MKQCSAHIETSQVQDITAVVTKPCSAYNSTKEVQELPAVPPMENELADYELCEQIEGIYEEIPK